MMASITLCSKNAPASIWTRLLLLQVCFWMTMLALFCAPLAHAQNKTPIGDPHGVEIRQLQVVRNADGLQLNANMQFKLGAALQDALAKGVPLHFVAEADVRRDRWYWYDAKVRVVQRTMRLSYAPLTKRWRVSVQSASASEGADVNLSISFASQDEALAAISNIGRWRIAEASELDPSERYNIEYRFYLNLSQLPRPFQIGVNAQSEWNIDVSANVRPTAGV